MRFCAGDACFFSEYVLPPGFPLLRIGHRKQELRSSSPEEDEMLLPATMDLNGLVQTYGFKLRSTRVVHLGARKLRVFRFVPVMLEPDTLARRTDIDVWRNLTSSTGRASLMKPEDRESTYFERRAYWPGRLEDTFADTWEQWREDHQDALKRWKGLVDAHVQLQSYGNMRAFLQNHPYLQEASSIDKELTANARFSLIEHEIRELTLA